MVTYFGNLTQYQAEASITCDDGYDLKGDKIRTCMANGKWNGTKAKCVVKGTTLPLFDLHIIYSA